MWGDIPAKDWRKATARGRGFLLPGKNSFFSGWSKMSLPRQADEIPCRERFEAPCP
jgi:hypothetical protein